MDMKCMYTRAEMLFGLQGYCTLCNFLRCRSLMLTLLSPSVPTKGNLLATARLAQGGGVAGGPCFFTPADDGWGVSLCGYWKREITSWPARTGWEKSYE